MKVQKTFVFFSMFLIGFAYTNCGQVGDIELKSVPVNESLATDIPSDNPVSLPPKDPVQDIMTNCRNALAQNKLMVLSQKVNFEDTRIETGKENICEFSKSTQQQNSFGNLEQRNGYMQARYEQNRKLNLPTGAVICDIQMQNSLQSFRYDDVFFFSFNGYLLATNNRLAVNERLMPESRKLSENNFTEIYSYDWTKLRGAFFENEAHDYCAGASEGLGQCSWPVSEEKGEMKFTFSPSILISMSAGRPSNNQVFSFAITGDDNPNLDCYHEKLEFAMTVKYYLPASGVTP